MKKICFIAQFPPPIHGLSKAVELLYNSMDSSLFELEKVNTTNNSRFISNLIQVMRSKADIFYLTLSQSRGGNIRDLIFLKIIEYKKKKTVVHLHGGYYRKMIDTTFPNWQKNANYTAIKKVDAAIVLSDSLRCIFKDLVDESKIHVVHNCVEEEYIIDERCKDSKDCRHVLYLSNFIKTKGYMDVLKLAQIDREKNNGNYHFDFAGHFFSAEEYDEFVNYIKEKGLQESVTFHGTVSGEKKKELLRDSDIFILLTRYHKEGQPISILEAMANGLAIVATDHAAIPDMITDGENGIIVTEDMSSEDLYDKMLSMDLKKISVNNRNKVNNDYSQKQYIHNMEGIFDSV